MNRFAICRAPRHAAVSAIFGVVLALGAWSANAPAQTVVGYPPTQSPYRDLTTSQHITLFGGYYRAAHAPADAIPGSAPMFGLRYDINIAGPAQLFVRLARTSSERHAYNPTLPSTTRSLGTVSDPLLLADVGFSFNLTGRKSWHALVPTMGFGIGIANATKDVANDPYHFGTKFSFSTELGLRYVPSDRYELRLGVMNTFYQNHLPNGYFAIPTGDTTAILKSNTSKSAYVPNFAFTAGVAIPIFR